MTDLNYLYFREQVSMMRADAALCDKARASHLGLAESYGVAISRFRSMRGATSTFSNETTAQ